MGEKPSPISIRSSSEWPSARLGSTSASGKKLGSLPALIFSGVVCYAFITLSATMHYNALMAVFFSVSTGLLRRQRQYAVPKQQVLAGEFA